MKYYWIKKIFGCILWKSLPFLHLFFSAAKEKKNERIKEHDFIFVKLL